MLGGIMTKISNTSKIMIIKKFIVSIILMALLTQCATYDFSKPVVKQGNLISDKAIHRLKIGMPKADVAILMGTSLLSPLFNNNRWDYVYTIRQRGGPLLKKHVSVYFANDRLIRIES